MPSLLMHNIHTLLKWITKRHAYKKKSHMNYIIKSCRNLGNNPVAPRGSFTHRFQHKNIHWFVKGFLLDNDHTEPNVHKQFHNIKEQKACNIYMSV